MKDAYIYKDAAIRILRLRKQYGLTREEMAELVGVSGKCIYEIETGRKGFSASVLYRIAAAFGVDCDYIMTGRKDRGNKKICFGNNYEKE